MDKHIDNTETQIYGPALRDNLAAAFAGSAPEVKAFLAYLVKHQAAADKAMAEGMSKARGAASDLSAAAQAKSPEATAARKLLGGLSRHLASSRDLGQWSGDTKVFFPGGLSAIGKSASELVTALGVARAGFEKDKTVPDGAKLQQRVKAAEKTLKALATATGGAAAAARKGLSEQSAQKKKWLACYRGVALVAEGVLTFEGRPEEARSVVPHRAVPGGAKKKKAGAPAKSKAPAKK